MFICFIPSSYVMRVSTIYLQYIGSVSVLPFEDTVLILFVWLCMLRLFIVLIEACIAA